MKGLQQFNRKLMVTVLLAATLGPAGTVLADAQGTVPEAVQTVKQPAEQQSPTAAPQTNQAPLVTGAAGTATSSSPTPSPATSPVKQPEPVSPRQPTPFVPATGGPSSVKDPTGPTPTTGRWSATKLPSATEMAAQIKAGHLDPATAIKQAYARIAAANPALNSVIYQDEANAMAQLQAMQDAKGQDRPFYGVPLLIKGLGQAYKGWPDTDGLTFERDHRAGFTKTFVTQLQKMGFIIVGQTNFPELGLINVTTSLLYGDAHNPWDLTRNPGGSSGGSAAAIASGMVPVATGNDAGGSLRIPASWSGIIGLKPTQGIILGDPKSPSVVNFAEGQSINDLQGIFKGLMNPNMITGLRPVPQELNQLKIAYSTVSPVGTPVSAAAQQAVLQAVKFLKAQGFTVVEQAAPVDGIKLMQNYFLGALSDGAVANYQAQSYLKRKLTAADVTNGVVSPMTYALYQASLKAPTTVSQDFKNELALVQQQMAAFHQEYPIYLTPTTATVAPKNSDPAFLPAMVTKLTQISQLNFPDQMKLIYAAWLHGLTKTPFTQLANLAGEPALSLPTYVSATGLPLGIQLEGAPGADFILLALGKLFESHHQFKLLRDQPVTAQPILKPQAPAIGTQPAQPGAKSQTTLVTPQPLPTSSPVNGAPRVPNQAVKALQSEPSLRGNYQPPLQSAARKQSRPQAARLPQTWNAATWLTLAGGLLLGFGWLFLATTKRRR